MKTLKDYHLIGKVHSVYSLEERKFFGFESIFKERSLKFDENGRLIYTSNLEYNSEEFSYDVKGNLSKWVIGGRQGVEERKLKYIYNPSGVLIEVLTYSKKPYSSKSELLFRKEIININGRKVEDRLFFYPNDSPCSLTKYLYKNNKIHSTETLFFDLNPGEVSRTQITTYDSFGRIIKLDLGDSSFIYKYNRKGSLIGEISYTKEVLYSETEFQYSDEGKLVSKVNQYSDKNEKWHYAYKTDNVGNWIEEDSKKLPNESELESISILKRRRFIQNDNESNVEFLTKREIEYYSQ